MLLVISDAEKSFSEEKVIFLEYEAIRRDTFLPEELIYVWIYPKDQIFKRS